MSTVTSAEAAPAGRPGRRGISGTAFVVLCVLAAGGFVAFLVFVSPILLARTQAAAPPPAPQEIEAGEIAGQRWTATAVERGEDEPCLELHAGGTATRTCTVLRGPALRAAESREVGGVPVVHGIVDARTTLVRLEFDGGQSMDLEPAYVDFGFPLGFFAAPLPSGARLAVVQALDRDGEERGRLECQDGGGGPSCVAP